MCVPSKESISVIDVKEHKYVFMAVKRNMTAK